MGSLNEHQPIVRYLYVYQFRGKDMSNPSDESVKRMFDDESYLRGASQSWWNAENCGRNVCVCVWIKGKRNYYTKWAPTETTLRYRPIGCRRGQQEEVKKFRVSISCSTRRMKLLSLANYLRLIRLVVAVYIDRRGHSSCNRIICKEFSMLVFKRDLF